MNNSTSVPTRSSSVSKAEIAMRACLPLLAKLFIEGLLLLSFLLIGLTTLAAAGVIAPTLLLCAANAIIKEDLSYEVQPVSGLLIFDPSGL